MAFQTPMCERATATSAGLILIGRVRLGSRVAYRGSDLNEWLAAQTVRPTDGPQAGT